MSFFADLRTIVTLTCRQASQLLSKAQDTPLTTAERVGLRLHLLICSACRRFRHQLALIRQVIRTRAAHFTGSSLSADRRRELLTRIRLAIRKKL